MKKSKIKPDRKYTRIDLPLKIEIDLHNNCRNKTIATKNISGGGLGLLLDNPFYKGNILKLKMKAPGWPRAITATAKIVYCLNSKSNAKLQIGLAFIKIAKKDKELMDMSLAKALLVSSFKIFT
jgi:c-di-GMP-binding flagellar brake protein YcgR